MYVMIVCYRHPNCELSKQPHTKTRTSLRLVSCNNSPHTCRIFQQAVTAISERTKSVIKLNILVTIFLLFQLLYSLLTSQSNLEYLTPSTWCIPSQDLEHSLVSMHHYGILRLHQCPPTMGYWTTLRSRNKKEHESWLGWGVHTLFTAGEMLIWVWF